VPNERLKRSSEERLEWLKRYGIVEKPCHTAHVSSGRQTRQIGFGVLSTTLRHGESGSSIMPLYGSGGDGMIEAVAVRRVCSPI
jgi:hypothetical protein